jgi:hypothetical protein
MSRSRPTLISILISAPLALLPAMACAQGTFEIRVPPPSSNSSSTPW